MKIKLFLVFILAFGTLLFALNSGPKKIYLTDLTKLFATKLQGKQIPAKLLLEEKIIFSIRLPRILLAFLVGAMLALSGSVLQNILENPLADPFLLGISSGAGFGAALAILCEISIFPAFFAKAGFFFPSFFALLFSVLTCALIYFLGVYQGKIQPEKLILAGVALNSLLSTFISLILIFSNKRDMIIFYLMGSLDTYYSYYILFVLYIISLFLFLFTFAHASQMDLLTLGERKACSMGVESELCKRKLFFLSGCMVSLAVSFGGIIGFMGLFIPHIFRSLFGFQHRYLLPLCCFGGGFFLLFCDTLARTSIPGSEIPVGIFTALVGCPFFLWLLWRKRSVLY
ncbi:FecCD family ABC transporter permease [Candidatus Riflebacteria bacterium]